MPGFTLNSKERLELEGWVRTTDTASVLRRVQALLWLDEGTSAEEVAELLFVSRAAVYKWVRQFQERQGLEVEERVAGHWSQLKDSPTRVGRFAGSRDGAGGDV